MFVGKFQSVWHATMTATAETAIRCAASIAGSTADVAVTS